MAESKGWMAATDGRKQTANPYEKGTALYQCWLNGWLSAWSNKVTEEPSRDRGANKGGGGA